MVVKIYVDSLVLSKETKNVFCNMCGSEIKKDDFGNFYDYAELEKKWGYLSCYDGQNHRFDLCQSCYKKLIDSFKIPVDE